MALKVKITAYVDNCSYIARLMNLPIVFALLDPMLVAVNAHSRLNIQHIFICAIFGRCSNNLILQLLRGLLNCYRLCLHPQEVQPLTSLICRSTCTYKTTALRGLLHFQGLNKLSQIILHDFIK